jgi:hypothetical protein
MINKELLDILACPLCKQKLLNENDKLICQKCRKEYKIIDGIPVLLSDQAQSINDLKEK